MIITLAEHPGRIPDPINRKVSTRMRPAGDIAVGSQ